MCQAEVWRRGKSTKRKSDRTWKTVDLNEMERTGRELTCTEQLLKIKLYSIPTQKYVCHILIFYKLATEGTKRILKLLVVCKEKNIFNQDTKQP